MRNSLNLCLIVFIVAKMHIGVMKVVNNINDKAFVFENNLSQQENPPNYIQIELKGDKLNPKALGAKVVIRLSDNSIQFQEQQTSRGYMSSTDPVMYFGLGKEKSIQSIEILWPNGSVSKINNHVS